MVTEEYFTSIVNETKGVVLSAVKANLFERYDHAIDDVVQETYLRAYKALAKNKFKEESSLSTWLYAIARNESLRMNLKLGRHDNKKEGFFAFLKISGKNESEAFERIEISEIVKKLDLLPEKYQAIIKLHYEGLNEEQIAQRLSLPQGTVKSRMHRGKKIMQKIIIEGGGQQYE